MKKCFLIDWGSSGVLIDWGSSGSRTTTVSLEQTCPWAGLPCKLLVVKLPRWRGGVGSYLCSVPWAQHLLAWNRCCMSFPSTRTLKLHLQWNNQRSQSTLEEGPPCAHWHWGLQSWPEPLLAALLTHTKHSDPHQPENWERKGFSSFPPREGGVAWLRTAFSSTTHFSWND